MNKLQAKKLLMENFQTKNDVVLEAVQKYADEQLDKKVVVSEMNDNEFEDFISEIDMGDLLETEIDDVDELDESFTFEKDKEFFKEFPKKVEEMINNVVGRLYQHEREKIETERDISLVEDYVFEKEFSSKSSAELFIDTLEESNVDYDIFINEEQDYDDFYDCPEDVQMKVVVYDTLDEAKTIKKVNSKGEKTKKKKCPPGFKWNGKTCKKISGAEKISIKKRIKKAVRTKSRKGTGYQKKITKKRNKAMKRRKGMGL